MSKIKVRPVGLAVTLALGAVLVACHDSSPTLTEPASHAPSANIGPGSSKELVPFLLDAPPGAQVFPRAINVAGSIVGSYNSAGSGVTYPAEWSRKDGFHALALLPGASSGVAVSINSEGTIVGTEIVSESETHGVIWSRQGRAADLGTSFFPIGINERGQIAGTHATAASFQPAILWHGRIQDLGNPPQFAGCNPLLCETRAAAINQKGEVIGTASLEAFDLHVAVWRPRSGWTIYQPLNRNEAVGINDFDDLVGTNFDSLDRPIARFWPRAGNPIDVGTLGGERATSVARGLNDFGVVVGNASQIFGSGAGGGAFRWTRAGGIERLPTIDGLGTSAAAINDLGEIAGVIGGRPAIWTWRLTPR